ncbi:MAG: DUF1254 domain-containing protein [Actinobacteria bacterium]|nr:DUF1254 domain-containing protein [Actinomycetota bacterium]
MPTLDRPTADQIAVDAYIYLYPLVLMERTRLQMTNVMAPGDRIGRGPVDAFVHIREFPPADFKDVVKPNFDTLYSPAWLDLREEPRIVSVPETDLYYVLPMYDAWSDIFACPGPRTTGTGAGHYALCGPGWDGALPDGVERIDAPTPWVWIISRAKASPATYDEVHAFQDQLAITALGAWPGPAATPQGTVDAAVDDDTPPLRQVFGLDAAAFFAEAAELMKGNAPHLNDHPVLARMARLGLVAGQSFDLAAAAPEARAALEAAVPTAIKRITARQQTLAAPVDGWISLVESMGAWGTNYLRRACIDLIGLGANLPEDAIYPVSYFDADGEPYDGSNSYVLHFDAGALPPAKAFWSLTMYDEEGFQVANPIDRFAIGDRDDLKPNPDGSLDLQISAAEPAEGSSNWLPSPTGSFNLCLRLYEPDVPALDGDWRPPAVRKA